MNGCRDHGPVCLWGVGFTLTQAPYHSTPHQTHQSDSPIKTGDNGDPEEDSCDVTPKVPVLQIPPMATSQDCDQVEPARVAFQLKD